MEMSIFKTNDRNPVSPELEKNDIRKDFINDREMFGKKYLSGKVLSPLDLFHYASLLNMEEGPKYLCEVKPKEELLKELDNQNKKFYTPGFRIDRTPYQVNVTDDFEMEQFKNATEISWKIAGKSNGQGFLTSCRDFLIERGESLLANEGSLSFKESSKRASSLLSTAEIISNILPTDE